ncbi:MAG: hypothetical protein ACYCOR_06985 [Acidobacteriaceae bacterium]
MKSDAEKIREYARTRYIEPARHGGESTVRIKSGDIVKGLNLKNKTPNVCTALRSKIFQDVYGVRLLGEQGPPSGMSTTVVFTYSLMNQGQTKEPKSGSQSAFDRLRGIAKTAFKDTGDWERSVQRERENFYRKPGAKQNGKRG